MRKNLFRDWSKSDFGYALKIIANVALITAAVVFTLNVDSSYLWQSIILGIVFLIGSFYTEYCCLSFRSDTYIGNALCFAVFCLVIFICGYCCRRRSVFAFSFSARRDYVE